MKVISSVAALSLLCGAAHAENLLRNGNFEANPPPSGCAGNLTVLQGWTVVQGAVDVESAVPNCSQVTAAGSGTHWIDLTGSSENTNATIRQDVRTIVGRTYLLTFYVGANAEWQPGCFFSGYSNDGSVKSMTVFVNGKVGSSGEVGIYANYSMDTTGQACTSANWTLEGLQFTATENTTEITFHSNDSSGVYGPLLDGVFLRLLP